MTGRRKDRAGAARPARAPRSAPSPRPASAARRKPASSSRRRPAGAASPARRPATVGVLAEAPAPGLIPERVCIVTQALYPYILGGAPIGAHELANALERAGVRVDLHTVDYRRPPEADVKADVLYGLERHRFPRLPWDAIGTAGNPFAWRMLRAVERSPAPVVHLRSHLFFTSVFGALGARRAGKAIVLSVHGVRAVRGSLVNLMQEVWLRTLGRWLFRAADRVVCLTTRDRGEVLRYGARPSRLHVLWNSYNPGLFHPPAAGEPTEKVVLWLGRHVEEKGLRFLVDAWARVAPRHPDHRLVLIGDGPLRREREEQVRRLGLEGSVRFEPFLPQAEAAARLRRCALFALPSLQEGFPLTVVEAMACGKPVVTAAPGLEEVVGEAGLVVPPRDPAALAAALEAYLGDEGRRRRDGAAAARRAAGRYGMDALARSYLGVYAAALEDRAARAGRDAQERP